MATTRRNTRVRTTVTATARARLGTDGRWHGTVTELETIRGALSSALDAIDQMAERLRRIEGGVADVATLGPIPGASSGTESSL